jgi:TonB family protein
MSASRALPPLPPPLAARFPALRKMRGLLIWGFGISVLLHAVFGPIAGRYKPPVAEDAEVTMISLSRKISIKLPTPAPTKAPTPAPTPLVPPQRSALPRPVAAAPQAHLNIHVYKASAAHAHSASSEAAYRARPGSETGVPQGTLASAPPAAPAAASGAAPGPGPSEATVAPVERTAPPACAEPNVEAKATRLAEPWYPESARELGTAGEADVLVSLSASGAVTSATIYRSSGSAALDASAIMAARQSTYAPEVANCVPAAGSYTFHASFALSDVKP